MRTVKVISKVTAAHKTHCFFKEPSERKGTMPHTRKRKDRGILERPEGSGIWWIDYYADGVRKREKAGRKGDAIKLYQKRRTEILQSVKLPENMRAAGVRFKVLANEILAYSKIHHRDTRNVESRVTKINSEFGERIADKIKPAEIDRWISEITTTPGTANRYRATFSLIFREALRNGEVTSNPARLVRQRHESGGRIRFLRDEEEIRLRGSIKKLFPEHQGELTISIGTGMRLSEQYGLTWGQVDFARKEVHLAKTKNGDARDVPMNADVLAAFQSLKEQSGAKKGTRVFEIKNPRSWFETARDDAKIEGYSWHDNRHTFCSRLIMAGVGLKTVQTLAGHKTISMTARYSHLASNSLHEAVESLLKKKRRGRKAGKRPRRIDPKRRKTPTDTTTDTRDS